MMEATLSYQDRPSQFFNLPSKEREYLDKKAEDRELGKKMAQKIIENVKNTPRKNK